MSDAPAFQVPTIEVRSPQPHAALVVLAGEHDLCSADQLRQTLDMSLSGCDHLIVDLSAVEFIDSTIIGVLVQTMKKATGVGRKFSVVLGTAPAVERALEVSGVLPLLNVVPTVERALAVAPTRQPAVWEFSRRAVPTRNSHTFEREGQRDG
jgi:anti-anti-sigma factor